MEIEKHYIYRSGWLRAAVLGANDGIISTASIVIGVAAASQTKDPILLSGVAGLVAGALSMAAGEYVSVSSQADLETADLERELDELERVPEAELQELAEIYQKRGLDEKLSIEVAKQLTDHNALEAHARDELGINEISKARPMQAAFASGAAFTFGGALPVLVVYFFPMHNLIYLLYGSALLFLIVLGTISAYTGGSSIGKAIIRLAFWGTMAMGITALIGYLFGVNMA
jgi:VIT1/CCC1 family predicted Fe2+/Mn2+ transporter